MPKKILMKFSERLEKTLMIFNKWKIEIKFLPIHEKSSEWLYRWSFGFILFHFWASDLSGILTICNVSVTWNKMFWSHK